MRNLLRTFLLFALLIGIISSAIWLVIRLQYVPSGKYVGFRCNGESTPEYWISVANRYAALIPESSPGGIWIIASSKVLSFDAATDAALTALDNSRVKVYLQPGEEVPGVWNQYPAPCDQLIQATLNNYGHHPCVIGVGLDIELRGSAWDDPIPVTDAEAQAWLNIVKSYNSDFEMFLKEFREWVMPPTYRADIIFVCMKQEVNSLDELISSFQTWANTFSPAKSAFQIGYPSDKGWWSQLANPPKDIAQALFQNIPNAKWVYWVNFNVHDVFP